MTTQTQTRTWTLRRAEMDDLEPMVEMANAGARVYGGQQFTAEAYRGEWEDPALDLARDVRVAEADDGDIVGVIEVWNAPPYVHNWLWGRVHPDWEGQGIGTALLRWAEGRARERIDDAPDGTRVSATVATPSTNDGAKQLFADHGFSLVRHHLTMGIEFDEAPPVAPRWPDGITVRPLASAAREQLEVAYRVDREAFRDHWGHVEEPYDLGLERVLVRVERDPTFDPSLWFVAWNGDEAVGISLCSVASDDPAKGWVQTLAVLRSWRQRGIGLALLQHSFAEFVQRGFVRAGLGVDAQNLTGALRLYERAGMRPVERGESYEKEFRPGIDLVVRGDD